MEETNSLKKSFNMKKIGVLMGGMSAERDISLKTGSSILDALIKKGYNAVAIDVNPDPSPINDPDTFDKDASALK